jgi:hypothetical protein
MSTQNKVFKIPREKIKKLIANLGSCYASDRITVDGLPVGYLYREEPENEIDSGWRFFSGDESQDYADNPDNFAIYDVNTICNYDAAVIPLLDSPYGSAFGREPSSDSFTLEPLNPPE